MALDQSRSALDLFGVAESNDAGYKQPNDHNWQNDKTDENDQQQVIPRTVEFSNTHVIT